MLHQSSVYTRCFNAIERWLTRTRRGSTRLSEECEEIEVKPWKKIGFHGCALYHEINAASGEYDAVSMPDPLMVVDGCCVSKGVQEMREYDWLLLQHSLMNPHEQSSTRSKWQYSSILIGCWHKNSPRQHYCSPVLKKKQNEKRGNVGKCKQQVYEIKRKKKSQGEHQQ